MAPDRRGEDEGFYAEPHAGDDGRAGEGAAADLVAPGDRWDGLGAPLAREGKVWIEGLAPDLLVERGEGEEPRLVFLASPRRDRRLL